MNARDQRAAKKDLTTAKERCRRSVASLCSSAAKGNSMGWASGSEIAVDVITVIRDQVDDEEKRAKIYRVLYDSLRSQDWDTVSEARGIDPVFDKIAGMD